MSPAFPVRRRAEQFATLVEGTSTGGDSARSNSARSDSARSDSARSDSPDLADLAELVSAMRSLPRPDADPSFVADLRTRLMAEAATALAPAETTSRSTGASAPTSVQARLTVPTNRTRRERRLAVLVGSVALAGATTSMAYAAQSALPGDALYSVKRAIEDVHTRVGTSDASRGATLLASATDRLHEAEALSRTGDAGDAAAIQDTLDTFTDQAGEASDHLLADYDDTGNDASIVALREFTTSSIQRLAILEPDVPSQARPALLEAARSVVGIDQLATAACPACAGPSILEVPSVLAGATITVPTTPPSEDSAPEALAPLATPGASPGSGPGLATPTPSLAPDLLNATEIPSGLPTIAVPTIAPTVPPIPLPTATGRGPGSGGGGGGGGGNGGGGKGGGGIIKDLTDPLIGTPTSTPTLPDVGAVVDDTVDGVLGTVTGILDGLTGGLGGGQPSQ